MRTNQNTLPSRNNSLLAATGCHPRFPLSPWERVGVRANRTTFIRDSHL